VGGRAGPESFGARGETKTRGPFNNSNTNTIKYSKYTKLFMLNYLYTLP